MQNYKIKYIFLRFETYFMYNFHNYFNFSPKRMELIKAES